MKSSPKVLNSGMVEWSEKESRRLSFDMVFKELHQEAEPEEQVEVQPDPEVLLADLNREWEARMEEAVQQAREEGRNEGRQEGYAQASKEFDHRLHSVNELLQAGHEEWKQRQELLEPGILDLVFELCEGILGVPVENQHLENALKNRLLPILQQLEEQTKPVIRVSERELDTVKMLKEVFAPKMHIIIESDPKLNPGEFEVETNEEHLVHTFRAMLSDLRNDMDLPTWS